MPTSGFNLDLSRIAAPMVNQSDLPFRVLVRRYNASLVYTQMLLPERLLEDREYLEFHTLGLRGPQDMPVVVQLCGNDPDVLVRAARKVVDEADAIGACSSSTICAYSLLTARIFSKTCRSEPWMSTRRCERRTLWRLPSWSEGLATRREHWYVCSRRTLSRLEDMRPRVYIYPYAAYIA